MSERDGWNHLYLIDAQTGVVKNQITRGDGWSGGSIALTTSVARSGFRPEASTAGKTLITSISLASISTAPAWSCSPRATARTRSSIHPIAGSSSTPIPVSICRR